MARGEGAWLWDTEGNRYLDMTSSQGVAMLGHSHPALTAAIAEQAQRLISCPNFFYNETRARFAAKLIEVLPDHLAHAFWPTAAPRPSTAPSSLRAWPRGGRASWPPCAAFTDAPSARSR